jgi:hypothetical protein
MSFQWPLALLCRRKVGHPQERIPHRADIPEAAAGAAEQRPGGVT